MYFFSKSTYRHRGFVKYPGKHRLYRAGLANLNKIKIGNYVNDLIFQIGSQGHIFKEYYKDEIQLQSFTETKNKSFIFTLNQDLFFERLYLRNFRNHSIPGIDNNPEWFTTNYNQPLEESDYCKLPSEDELNNKDILLGGNYFLINKE